jgi:hypothetical protein
VVLIREQRYCGSGGCSFAIFKGTKSRYSLVSSSTITVPPIRFTEEKSYGWKTLIVNSGGTGTVELRFNGSRHPLNPSMQQRASSQQVAASRVLIAEPLHNIEVVESLN